MITEFFISLPERAATAETSKIFDHFSNYNLEKKVKPKPNVEVSQ